MGTTLQIVMWVCTEIIQQPTEHERGTVYTLVLEDTEVTCWCALLSKIVVLDCPTNKLLLHIVLYVCIQVYSI